MSGNPPTSVIYALAAGALSLFMLSRNLEPNSLWWVLLLLWAFAVAVPLLFAFAYTRFVFANGVPGKRKYALLFHCLIVLAVVVLFTVLSPFWKNPLRDNDSIFLLLAPLAVLSVLCLAAILLLLKHKSTLATLGSILFWPYWLILALTFEGRWFQEDGIRAASYLLCFSVPVLFAFAAGTVSSHPTIAHSAAIAGLVSAPWLYWSVLRDSGLGNVWLVYNVPDGERQAYTPLYSHLAIVAVGLLVLGVAVGGLRLLPAHWTFRGSSFRERTWPGVAVSLAVLAVWFSQSVMPYRIPGTVDYSDYPVLQILHVEKRGLQFHESCVNVWGAPHRPISVSFSGDNRRLFQYRFRQNHSSVKPPEILVDRIRALIKSSAGGGTKSDIVRPIRTWNADGWYFNAHGSGLKIYGTSNEAPPPQEIVDLFHDLDKIPRSPETRSELKDVCLGFCFDPVSAMGRLYANHRCFNDGHGTVCR